MLLIVKFIQSNSLLWQNIYLENGYYLTSTILLSVSVFTLFQSYTLSKNTQIILNKIGSSTLGIYYIHMFIAMEMSRIVTRNYCLLIPLPWNFLKTIFVFLISFSLTYLCGKIPIIQKLFM